MIFTNVSWIGDFFMLWPVASWYYKTHNEKIHFVVSQNYYMYEKVKKFLEHQDFCEKVTLIDIGSDAWNLNNWKFNPADFGIEGKYYNFGFVPGTSIDVYMSEYYAKLNNLDYDHEMTLKLIDFPNTTIHSKVTIPVAHQLNGFWRQWKFMMPSDVVELDINLSFEENVYKAYHADERHLGSSSLPIVLDMLGVRSTIYAGQGFPENVFFKQNHNIIKI
jgi:hypothetical protein